MIKIEKIGDIFKLLSHSTSDNPMKPKRITFDLSEDGTFYHTKIYVNIIDRNKNEEYEGYIECKSKIPSFVEDFNLVYDHEDRDAEIFTIIIPDENWQLKNIVSRGEKWAYLI